MMLLLEPAGQGIHEECIRRAFKGVETEEEFKRYNELFESYMLGGVEELYERLVLQKEEIDTDYSDDKTANLMMLFERFAPNKIWEKRYNKKRIILYQEIIGYCSMVSKTEKL